MALFDMPLDQLKTYRPDVEAPGDFDAFWEQTLAETRARPLNAVFEPVEFGLRTVETFDVTFSGFEGQPIKGWLLLPRERAGRVPCVVEYIGYGGGRGHPTDWLVWSSVGYAHLVMDTRGQGGSWLHGNTGDAEPEGASPHHPGFMTRGIASPQTYYYRRVFADAVRAVETARSHPAVHAERLAVAGISQGGGIALAASALAPGVKAVMSDVPFLCHFRRATEITDSNPYAEISRYCTIQRDKVEQVFATLSYFDGVNFAQRARCSALFSVGLMDQVCPPSTVFAAYNHFGGPKEIRVWGYNQHEGGGSFQTVERIRYLRKLFD